MHPEFSASCWVGEDSAAKGLVLGWKEKKSGRAVGSTMSNLSVWSSRRGTHDDGWSLHALVPIGVNSPFIEIGRRQLTPTAHATSTLFQIPAGVTR